MPTSSSRHLNCFNENSYGMVSECSAITLSGDIGYLADKLNKECGLNLCGNVQAGIHRLRTQHANIIWSFEKIRLVAKYIVSLKHIGKFEGGTRLFIGQRNSSTLIFAEVAGGCLKSEILYEIDFSDEFKVTKSSLTIRIDYLDIDFEAEPQTWTAENTFPDNTFSNSRWGTLSNFIKQKFLYWISVHSYCDSTRKSIRGLAGDYYKTYISFKDKADFHLSLVVGNEVYVVHNQVESKVFVHQIPWSCIRVCHFTKHGYRIEGALVGFMLYVLCGKTRPLTAIKERWLRNIKTEYPMHHLQRLVLNGAVSSTAEGNRSFGLGVLMQEIYGKHWSTHPDSLLMARKVSNTLKYLTAAGMLEESNCNYTVTEEGHIDYCRQELEFEKFKKNLSMQGRGITVTLVVGIITIGSVSNSLINWLQSYFL